MNMKTIDKDRAQTAQRYERGAACRALGLLDEAASEWRRILSAFPEHAGHAVGNLQELALGEGRPEEAIRLGEYWKDHCRDNKPVINFTGQALVTAGRFADAVAFLRAHHAEHRSAHNMACAYANLGQPGSTLFWLNYDLVNHRPYADDYALGDQDLRPLWPALAGLARTRAGAHLLLLPGPESLAEPRRGSGCNELDLNAWRALPPDLQSLFRFDAELGYFRLDACAALARPGEAARANDLRRITREAARQLLGRARCTAFDTVLAVQPLYAAAQATDGNFTAARWHFQWALFHQPDLLPEFRRLARPGAFGEMVEAFARLLERDPESARLLLRIRHLHFVDGEEAARLHRTLPATVRDDTQFLFNAAILAGIEGEPDEALEFYRRVRAACPEDAAAWINSADIHLGRGEVKEALSLLEQGPASAGDFALFHHQLDRCCARPPSKPGASYLTFRGGLDLNGALTALGPRATRLMQPIFRSMHPDLCKQTTPTTT